MQPCSPSCSVRGCTPMSANRFTVACCIVRLACSLPRSWLLSRPQVHCTRAGAENERAAGMPVDRQRVVGGPAAVGRAVVLQPLHALRPSCRTAESAQRAGSRCRDPRPTRSRACRPAARSDAPVARPASGRCCARNAVGRSAAGTRIARRARVDREDGARQRVLGPAAIGRRAEARITPGAGPVFASGSILALAWVSL